MEKNQLIERALHKYALGMDNDFGDVDYPGLDYAALAEQAIAIDCEVEHWQASRLAVQPSEKRTYLIHRLMSWDGEPSIYKLPISFGEHLGIAGKATVMIISSEVKDESPGIDEGREEPPRQETRGGHEDRPPAALRRAREGGDS